MTYQPYRVEGLGPPPGGAALGAFADFDTALATRDDDRAAREVAHLIVGPGMAGARAEHPVVTFAGVDPDEPNPAAEFEEARRRLQRIRRR